MPRGRAGPGVFLFLLYYRETTVYPGYPHRKEFVRYGKDFIGFRNDILFQKLFFAADWTELAEVSPWRLMKSEEVIRSASPSPAMA